MTKQINKTKQTQQSAKKKALELIKNSNPLRLSLDQIIAEDTDYNELVTVTFDDGRFTEVYKKFRPTTINKLFQDYCEFVSEYQKETGLTIDNTNTHNFISLHIIQYFSTLVGEFPKNISEKLDIFEKMLDNKLVKKTLESFDQNEISSVYQTFKEKLEFVNKILEEDEKTKEPEVIQDGV